jgi:hypothetical protein
MDQERFDALSRALASVRPRRGVLGLVLSATLLGHDSSVFAKSGKAKGKGHSKDGGQGYAKGKGRGHVCDKVCAELACEKTPVPSGKKAEFCCKGGFCSCGGSCCEGQCFQTGAETNPTKVFCCTGPKMVVCPSASGRETCCEGSCDSCDAPGPSGIAGSYRRR